MKVTTINTPRPSGTVTLKLDPSDRERLAALAEMKKRTPHYLMKEVILDYLRREEARQNFTQAAKASYAHYKETGLHISLDEFSAWADAVQTNPDLPLPACHS